MRARVAGRDGLARTALCVWLLVAGCGGPEDHPVEWSAAIAGPDTVAPGSIVRVNVEATPGRGWYFYSVTQPTGGPVPARIWLADSATFRQAGPLGSPEPSRSFDSVFGIELEKYSARTSFILPVRVPERARGPHAIRVSALYQACNDTICLSPRTVAMTVPVVVGRR